MRVIAGQCRGMVLRSFDTSSIRPTKDQVKESMFNMLANLIDLSVATVCDLFAGTGSLGIEALSRGARGVTFVENHPEAVRLLTSNLEKTRLTPGATIVVANVEDFLNRTASSPFDVVFADPPYEARLGDFVIDKLCANGYLADHGVVMYESGPDETFEAAGRHPELTLHRRRTWGQTLVTVFQKR